MPTYKYITSTILESNQSTVTISNIPQTYTDLVMRFTLSDQSATSDAFFNIRFNGNTTANYATRGVYRQVNAVSGWNIQTFGAGTQSQSYTISNDGDTSCFAPNEMYIYGYANSAYYKPVDIRGGRATGNNNYSGGQIGFGTHVLQLTNPITSISIIAANSGQPIKIGSSFFLYGISNS